jgi:large subunit ribosomal protein L10
MAVSKAKKTEQTEKLNAELKNVSNAVVATYSKLTVMQDYELRKTLRGVGAKYKVVKNTLAERAAKDTPEFTFKSGVVEGRVISIKEIEALATMPSKEELMSKLLFLMNAPAQRLVTAMNAVGRNLAVVVDQGVQQKKFKEA